MEEKRQKMRNFIKNIVLLVLFAGMLALSFATWLSDLDMDSMPSDSLAARIYQKFTYGVSGFEIRTGTDSAAQPTRVAVSVDGRLVGAQYQAASVSTLYAALQQSMGQALQKSKAFQACDEDDFRQALQEDVLYFGYEGAYPVSLLAGWMSDTDNAQTSTYKTDVLLLTAAGKLYLRTEDNQYYTAQTKTSTTTWSRAMENLTAAACCFAAQQQALRHVRPDTLLTDDTDLRVEQLTLSRPNLLDAESGCNLNELFEAFGYAAHVRSYQEDKGNTQVYAENYSTLHLSVDGLVRFRTSALEGGIEVYNAAEAEQTDTLRLRVDFAYTLLKAAQSSVSDNAQAMLYDIAMDEEDSHVCVLTFIQLVGGIPVETAQPFARFEFRDNRLMSADIRLQRFQLSGTQTPVLASTQAASAAPSDAVRMEIIYRMHGETATAERCYVQ